jgi:hypothetical protein
MKSGVRGGSARIDDILAQALLGRHEAACGVFKVELGNRHALFWPVKFRRSTDY